MDSNGEKDETTHTIIIPMHTDVRIGAVIFKERFSSDEDFKNFLEHFRYEKKEKLTKKERLFDLFHQKMFFQLLNLVLKLFKKECRN